VAAHPPARRGIGADEADAFLQEGCPVVQDLGLASHDALPDVVRKPVDLAAGTGDPFAAQEIQAAEVAHRPGDGGGTDLEALGQFGRGEPAFLADHQRREHAGRHRREARRGQDGGESLGEVGKLSRVPLCHRVRISVFSIFTIL
jgi:hypothetical protein